MNLKPGSPGKGILRQMHKAQEKYLEGWFDVPAHVHHTAYRMANPAVERPQSRKEFQQLLACLEIDPAHAVMEGKVGFGVKKGTNGDKLIAIWEAHTEYYSYQIWHIPSDATQPLGFGPLRFPGYVFPFSPSERVGSVGHPSAYLRPGGIENPSPWATIVCQQGSGGGHLRGHQLYSRRT